MNFKFYPLRAMLLTLLLFGFKARMQAQDILFNKTVYNWSQANDGTTADVGDTLIYTINITNLTTQNYVATKLYDNIPAGVSYRPGSTKLNGVVIADNAGKMPYSGNGGYINSPTNGVGILAPGALTTVEFKVYVTANGGSVFNNATIDATQNGVATIQATNTVVTNLSAVAACNVIYQVTPSSANSGGTYSYIRNVSTSSGAGGGTLFNGTNGTQRDAFDNSNIPSTGWGSTDLLDGCAAIAYDGNTNRIYFVNNFGGAELNFINLSNGIAYRMTDTILEHNTNNGYNVNRMGFGSDGWCYALTSNCRDFIRFRVPNTSTNVPIIERKGALINAGTNGNKDILNDGGGDLFADGSGKLYMIANSGNMYKINPANKIATYMGTVAAYPSGGDATQSLAINSAGQVFINGNYSYVYRIDLGNMNAVQVNTLPNSVYQSGDYTSCGFPVLASSIIADKTYRNINGSSTVNGGDTVEYIITVENIGNVNAAGVYMYDYIPPSTIYLPGTTKMNNIPIPDNGGIMPFAVSGGRLVNTYLEQGGIVKPGPSNAAVVTFRVVTEPNKQVCNQSRITLLDADGNVMFVNSSDPGNIGQTPTCFYSDGVLPLNNLKFKGTLNDDKSVLNWSMNGDDNVAYYEVEYSENGTAYKVIGKVGGKGLNNTVNTYQYVDAEHTFSTIRHYRLKAVYKNEGFSYSGVVLLNLKEEELVSKAVPNPFDRNINVRFSLKTAEQIRIRLIDLMGREVYSTTEQLGIGTHSIAIRIPTGLIKGMYVLDVRAGGKQILQKKMLKQ